MVVINLTITIITHIKEHSSIDDTETNCKIELSLTILFVCYCVCGYAITALFAYISIKLSEPLTAYWQSFLLICQSRDLNQVLRTQEEFSKAKKYNTAALKNANYRMLAIITDMKNERSSQRGLPTSADDSERISLTLHEREILLENSPASTSLTSRTFLF